MCLDHTIGVRISSPSHYQEVDKARGTQVDIQSEEKSSSDCVTIYKLLQKSPDHVTLLGPWYSVGGNLAYRPHHWFLTYI